MHRVLRFLSNIHIRQDGCWEWFACLGDSGYGAFNDHGKGHKAHRYIYELVYGLIPAGKQVLHKCDRPWCVCPDHLFLGTHKENMDDMTCKGRRRSGKNVRAADGGYKLTPAAVAEIQASNEPHQVLARKFNVNRYTITNVRKGITWKEVSA